MDFFSAIKRVHESKGTLMTSPSAIPGDAITWDDMTGWTWVRSGLPVKLLHPSLLFGPWLVGESWKS